MYIITKTVKEEVRPCVSCKENHFIYDRNRWLCKECYDNRKKLKLNRVSLKEEENRLNEVFVKVWEENPHYCFHCGKWLGLEMKPIFFSHILSRGAHPGLRCDPENIVLACMECHQIYDFGDRNSLKNQIPEERIEKLLEKEHGKRY